MFKKIFIIISSFIFFSTALSEEVFLSLKKNKVNVRYGPSFESPVKFIYKKIDLPIKQIDKKDNWRRIIDLKNNSGWIHSSQLKPINSTISLNDKILFDKPTIFSKPVAKIKKGRVLIVQNCQTNLCNVKTDNYKGWIENNNLWGEVK